MASKRPKTPKTEKALGSPSASSVGPSVPSGDAAPRPGMRTAGRAHESAGMSGEHAMAVPGMPAGQGGNRNPNRATSTGTRVADSTPMPHNRDNNAEPTNPRMTNGPGTQNAQPGRPPQPGLLPLPDMAHPEGRLPNNPRGETSVPTERVPRPRMF